MIECLRIILFVLVLSVTFAGCSNTDITKKSISEVHNDFVVEPYEYEGTVETLKETIPFVESTRIEFQWVSFYVRYKGQYYEISIDKEVDKSKVGRQIGLVKRYIPSSMVITGERFIEKDGDSNYLSKGSLIYESRGKDVKDSIIVDDNGIFKEAISFSN